MVPLGTLATVTATAGPDVIYRYNRFRAVQLLGGPAPGYSSGQAVAAMEDAGRVRSARPATATSGPAPRTRKKKPRATRA